MRILQIIDSLEIGGAEKMAVNFANALSSKIEFSGLVATRNEGMLLKQINKNVNYLFLRKKKAIDFKAIYKLKKYCKENRINILHAHGSSFFIAVLVKLALWKLKIVWHDHNGLREESSKKQTVILKTASFLFNGIIVVNYQLKNWALKELNCKNVIYLANFTTNNEVEDKLTFLKGNEEKKILCLANLRFPKNHLLLIDVAKKLKISNHDWSFHLVGKDYFDSYSDKLKSEILKNELENHIFLYGSKNDTQNIINQAQIAILTSESEGLPVALLEYGLYKKPVVSTNVGEIPLIIKNEINGFVVSKFDSSQFYLNLVKLIHDVNLRNKIGNALFETISANNSEKAIIGIYTNWLQEKLNGI